MACNSQSSKPALNINVYLKSPSCREMAPDSLSERILTACGLKMARVGHTSPLLTACCRIVSSAWLPTKKTFSLLLTMDWRPRDSRILRLTQPIPGRHVFCRLQSYHH